MFIVVIGNNYDKDEFFFVVDWLEDIFSVFLFDNFLLWVCLILKVIVKRIGNEWVLFFIDNELILFLILILY